LPESAKAELAKMAGDLRQAGVKASWVKPDRMHLTLRFLGEATPEQVEAVGDYLERAYAEQSGFECAVEGAGAFPNARRPSVIWAGVGPLEGGLDEVQTVAEEAAQSAGFAREKRAFRPHLTLGRVRRRKEAGDLAQALIPLQSFRGEKFDVKGVTLFSSTLTPQGPVYERLREIKFR
jgi:2'-5' RNA ligase